MKFINRFIPVFSSTILLCGCSAGSSVPMGAAAGGLVGAGAGAVIGSVLTNGNVMKSSLLGAAIGASVGMAAAALIDRSSEEQQRENYIRQVKYNQQQIYERQHEIDLMRDKLEGDAPRSLVPAGEPEHQYLGPSLGNPYR